MLRRPFIPYPLFQESDKPKTTMETSTKFTSRAQPLSHSKRPLSVQFRLKTHRQTCRMHGYGTIAAPKQRELGMHRVVSNTFFRNYTKSLGFSQGIFAFSHGAGNGTRTRDLQLGKLPLYQLSYARKAGTRKLCPRNRDLSRFCRWGTGVIQFLIRHESNSANRGKGARVFDPERIDGPDFSCFQGHSPDGERPWPPSFLGNRGKK